MRRAVIQKEEQVRKGIGDIMGGKVLELESKRLKAEGEAIGQARGEARLGSLINRLIQEQRTEEIQAVSTDPKRREQLYNCLLYTSPSPRDMRRSRMPSSA